MKTLAQRWYPRERPQQQQQQQPQQPAREGDVVGVLAGRGPGHFLLVKSGAAGSAPGGTLAQRLYPNNPSAAAR